MFAGGLRRRMLPTSHTSLGATKKAWLTVFAFKSFNRRQDEFNSLLDYNNYLEEVETLTFNLLNHIDVAATETKLAAYASQNAASISRNATLQTCETASLEAHEAAEREQARQRRESARREEEEERLEREESKQSMLDQLAQGAGNAAAIARESQRVVLKRSTARRSAAERQQAQQRANPGAEPLGSDAANGAADPSAFFIKGLKATVAPAPEKAYDPFAGVSDRKNYYLLQDHYEHPWLDRARTDVHITAGGYDVREYYARTLLEAFAGLGCFIEEEVAGREVGASTAVATAGAAVVAEGAGELKMDVVM